MLRRLRVLALFLVALTSGPVLADVVTGPRPASPRPATEEIEEVDDAVEVATPAAASAEPAGIASLLGRLHPAIVHLPIAWILLLLLLDIGGLLLNRDACRTCGLPVLGLAVLSCVPAITSGLLREGGMAVPPDVAGLIEDHEGVMFAVAGLITLALIVRVVRRNRLEGAWKAAYLAVVAAAAALVGYGGHLGGKIVYGKDFLPF